MALPDVFGFVFSLIQSKIFWIVAILGGVFVLGFIYFRTVVCAIQRWVSGLNESFDNWSDDREDMSPWERWRNPFGNVLSSAADGVLGSVFNSLGSGGYRTDEESNVVDQPGSVWQFCNDPRNSKIVNYPAEPSHGLDFDGGWYCTDKPNPYMQGMYPDAESCELAARDFRAAEVALHRSGTRTHSQARRFGPRCPNNMYFQCVREQWNYENRHCRLLTSFEIGDGVSSSFSNPFYIDREIYCTPMDCSVYCMNPDQATLMHKCVHREDRLGNSHFTCEPCPYLKGGSTHLSDYTQCYAKGYYYGDFKQCRDNCRFCSSSRVAESDMPVTPGGSVNGLMEHFEEVSRDPITGYMPQGIINGGAERLAPSQNPGVSYVISPEAISKGLHPITSGLGYSDWFINLTPGSAGYGNTENYRNSNNGSELDLCFGGSCNLEDTMCYVCEFFQDDKTADLDFYCSAFNSGEFLNPADADDVEYSAEYEQAYANHQKLLDAQNAMMSKALNHLRTNYTSLLQSVDRELRDTSSAEHRQQIVEFVCTDLLPGILLSDWENDPDYPGGRFPYGLTLTDGQQVFLSPDVFVTDRGYQPYAPTRDDNGDLKCESRVLRQNLFDLEASLQTKTLSHKINEQRQQTDSFNMCSFEVSNEEYPPMFFSIGTLMDDTLLTSEDANATDLPLWGCSVAGAGSGQGFGANNAMGLQRQLQRRDWGSAAFGGSTWGRQAWTDSRKLSSHYCTATSANDVNSSYEKKPACQVDTQLNALVKGFYCNTYSDNNCYPSQEAAWPGITEGNEGAGEQWTTWGYNWCADDRFVYNPNKAVSSDDPFESEQMGEGLGCRFADPKEEVSEYFAQNQLDAISKNQHFFCQPVSGCDENCGVYIRTGCHCNRCTQSYTMEECQDNPNCFLGQRACMRAVQENQFQCDSAVEIGENCAYDHFGLESDENSPSTGYIKTPLRVEHRYNFSAWEEFETRQQRLGFVQPTVEENPQKMWLSTFAEKTADYLGYVPLRSLAVNVYEEDWYDLEGLSSSDISSFVKQFWSQQPFATDPSVRYINCDQSICDVPQEYANEVTTNLWQWTQVDRLQIAKDNCISRHIGNCTFIPGHPAALDPISLEPSPTHEIDCAPRVSSRDLLNYQLLGERNVFFGTKRVNENGMAMIETGHGAQCFWGTETKATSTAVYSEQDVRDRSRDEVIFDLLLDTSRSDVKSSLIDLNETDPQHEEYCYYHDNSDKFGNCSKMEGEEEKCLTWKAWRDERQNDQNDPQNTLICPGSHSLRFQSRLKLVEEFSKVTCANQDCILAITDRKSTFEYFAFLLTTPAGFTTAQTVFRMGITPIKAAAGMQVSWYDPFVGGPDLNELDVGGLEPEYKRKLSNAQNLQKNSQSTMKERFFDVRSSETPLTQDEKRKFRASAEMVDADYFEQLPKQTQKFIRQSEQQPNGSWKSRFRFLSPILGGSISVLKVSVPAFLSIFSVTSLVQSLNRVESNYLALGGSTLFYASFAAQQLTYLNAKAIDQLGFKTRAFLRSSSSLFAVYYLSALFFTGQTEAIDISSWAYSSARLISNESWFTNAVRRNLRAPINAEQAVANTIDTPKKNSSTDNMTQAQQNNTTQKNTPTKSAEGPKPRPAITTTRTKKVMAYVGFTLYALLGIADVVFMIISIVQGVKAKQQEVTRIRGEMDLEDQINSLQTNFASFFTNFKPWTGQPADPLSGIGSIYWRGKVLDYYTSYTVDLKCPLTYTTTEQCPREDALAKRQSKDNHAKRLKRTKLREYFHVRAGGHPDEYSRGAFYKQR